MCGTTLDLLRKAWKCCNVGYVKDTSDSDEVTRLLAEAAAISAQAVETAAGGDRVAALRLEDRADAIRRIARRLARSGEANRASSGGIGRSSGEGIEAVGSRGPAASVRELTISALTELGVPSSPRSIADYIAARFGSQVDPRGLAAIRRDELRSWSSSRSQRPIYVVPALAGHRFVPLRGKVGLSAWALEDRLIGPWSERVDHLRATVNVSRQARWLLDAQPEQAQPLIDLLSRYAATVAAANPSDPASVEDAATAELASMQDADREWRTDAGERARAVLDERGQLWGAELPAIIGRSAG
jgi:hypothetical protein